MDSSVVYRFMGSGIYAELAVGCPTGCALGDLGREVPVTAVRRSAAGDDRVRVEFTVEDGGIPEDARATGTVDGGAGGDSFEPVFDHGGGSVYRYSREPQGCACDLIERHGCPVRSAAIRNGILVVSFFAPTAEVLRTVVTDLRDATGDVSVRQLTQPTDGDEDVAVFDRSELTDRQREVLRTAHDMGYFSHPRDASARDVADEVGICVSTFTEHLAAAQRKLMTAVVD